MSDILIQHLTELSHFIFPPTLLGKYCYVHVTNVDYVTESLSRVVEVECKFRQSDSRFYTFNHSATQQLQKAVSIQNTAAYIHILKLIKQGKKVIFMVL